MTTLEGSQTAATRTRAGLWLDLACITALLLLAAFPLIVLRDMARFEAPPHAARFVTLGGGLALLWLAAARRLRSTSAAVTESPPAETPGAWGWALGAAAGGILLALTLVTFYQPMLKQFWNGYDDLWHLEPTMATPWSVYFDRQLNRPLTFSLSALARTLGPARIDTFLWLGVGLWLANGLVLFAVLRQMFPRASAVPWLAAAFLVLSHSDPTRYAVMFATVIYQTALLYCQGAVWLFLVSYRTQRRSLLLGSCLFLGAALLSTEGLFPLALLGPVLLWVSGRRGRDFVVWSYFWVGTMGLLAVRVGIFFWFFPRPTAECYQFNVARYALQNPQLFWEGLAAKVTSLLVYFRRTGSLEPYLGACLAAASLAGALAWVATRRSGALRGSRWGLAAGVGLAVLAFALGLVPFVLLVGTPGRAQYFAAPGLATLLACAVCLVAGWLPRLVGRLAVAACLGYVALLAAAESHREQDATGPNRFVGLVHILEQLPRMTPDTLVVLVPEQGTALPPCVPHMQQYTLPEAARMTLGIPVFIANVDDPSKSKVCFKQEGVTAHTSISSYQKRYDQVVAFRLGADLGLSLLRRLPPALVPAGSHVERYDPLARILPAPAPRVPYFRYPAGTERWCDLFDSDAGVLLGQNWSRLETDGRRLFRWACRDAELVVSSPGHKGRELRLELEPGRRYLGKVCPLEVLDEASRVVATATLRGRQEVRLTVPTNPTRVSVLRLRVRDDSRADRAFRLFRPGGKARRCRLPDPQPPDIAHDGLKLGANWHPPQSHGGEVSRRAGEGAEVSLGVLGTAHRALALEVEPGPGGVPCPLEVRDEAGRTLARVRVQGRQQIRVPLPAEPRAGAVFRLSSGRDHAEGPVSLPPLDVRFFSCRCTD
jgi:hypothetical protein